VLRLGWLIGLLEAIWIAFVALNHPCLLHLKELLALSALFNLVCLQEADDDGDDIDDDDADEFIPFLNTLIRSC